jgi:hypothetical protein
VITTAEKSLNDAHRAVFDVARKADTVLAGHEGLGVTLGFAEIAAGIGLDLHALSHTDRFLTMLALEAALEHRGWSVVSEPGELKQFRLPMKRTHYRKPSISPVARARARA